MAERDPLDDFFEAARAAPAPASDDLMARIEADSLREMPTPKPAAHRPRPGLLSFLGGWPALAGLATAALAGVWIGVADPLSIDPLGYLGAGDMALADLSTGYSDLEWGTQ